MLACAAHFISNPEKCGGYNTQKIAWQELENKSFLLFVGMFTKNKETCWTKNPRQQELTALSCVLEWHASCFPHDIPWKPFPWSTSNVVLKKCFIRSMSSQDLPSVGRVTTSSYLHHGILKLWPELAWKYDSENGKHPLSIRKILNLNSEFKNVLFLRTAPDQPPALSVTFPNRSASRDESFVRSVTLKHGTQK